MLEKGGGESRRGTTSAKRDLHTSSGACSSGEPLVRLNLLRLRDPVGFRRA